MGKYSYEWFKKRAFGSLRKISDGVWDYSDSLLLYTPSGAEVYEEAQNTDTPYFKLVTDHEHKYLKSVAEDIISILPNNFEYIDLGPGTEHKEQYFFDEIKRQGKTFIYNPVDISDHFLDVAEKFAANQGIKTNKVKASFEELPAILGSAQTPRFVSLGLTASNFNLQEILTLLTTIAGKDGFVFINTQIKDRVDILHLQRIYEEVASKICEEKVKLLGLVPSKDTSEMVVDEELRLWLSVLNINEALDKVGIKKQDKLLVFQSLRYTKQQLEQELERTGLPFSTFDIGDSFIASLIKT